MTARNAVFCNPPKTPPSGPTTYFNASWILVRRSRSHRFTRSLSYSYSSSNGAPLRVSPAVLASPTPPLGYGMETPKNRCHVTLDYRKRARMLSISPSQSIIPLAYIIPSMNSVYPVYAAAVAAAVSLFYSPSSSSSSRWNACAIDRSRTT
jgi:hypothetical protein